MTAINSIGSATSEDAAAYDAWFRKKVARAIASPRPTLSHDQVMAMAKTAIDKHKTR